MNVSCYFSESLYGYTCTVTRMFSTVPNTPVFRFHGEHKKGKKDSDVKHLLIENQDVEYFPRNICATFYELTHLTIRNSGLKEITSRDFCNFENLRSLNLSGNKLKVLPDNLFENLPNMRHINFDSNQLTSLSSRMLDPIRGSLQTVSLRNNPDIDISFDERSKHYFVIDQLVSAAEQRRKGEEIRKSAQAFAAEQRRMAEEMRKAAQKAAQNVIANTITISRNGNVQTVITCNNNFGSSNIVSVSAPASVSVSVSRNYGNSTAAKVSRDVGDDDSDESFKRNLALALEMSAAEFRAKAAPNSKLPTAPAALSSPENSSTRNPQASSECAICWDSGIEVVFIPCGHCSCRSCAESIAECHLCRQKIERKQRIFCN